RRLRAVAGEEDARVLPGCPAAHTHAALLLAQLERCQVPELRAEAGSPDDGVCGLEAVVVEAHAIRLDRGEHGPSIQNSTLDTRNDAPRAGNPGAAHNARQCATGPGRLVLHRDGGRTRLEVQLSRLEKLDGSPTHPGEGA